MRIVHFIPILTKGGAERVVIDLANEAARRGHEVSLVAWIPAPPELGTNALSEQVSIRYLDHKGGSSRRAYVRLLPWVFSNRRWLLSQDVIHCHLSMGSAFGAAVQSLRRLYGRRRPIVVETYHAVGVPIPNFDRAAHASLLSWRDAVAFMAEDPYWTRFRSARRKRLFQTIPNGVSRRPAAAPASAERYRRDQAQIPDGVLVLGNVGRLVPERRPELLLETFIEITKQTDRDIHLLLAGDGPMRPKLQAEARRLGLADRVHLPGLAVEPAEAFANIDLYLTLNVGALTGIAALEAALAGLPIVAVQLMDDYKRDGSALIWSSTHPAEVAARAVELFDDPADLKALARRQSAYVAAHHSVDAMSDSYFRLYDQCLANRRGAPATTVGD